MNLMNMTTTRYLDRVIAFTLNPNPLKYKSADPIEQWRALLICIFTKGQISKTFIDFMFFPELTEAGNIHVHGFYIVKDNISYYRWFLPACKAWGFTYVKTRVDDEWIAYACKETEEDSAICQLVHNSNMPSYIDDENRKIWRDKLFKSTRWLTHYIDEKKKIENKIKVKDIRSYFCN